MFIACSSRSRPKAERVRPSARLRQQERKVRLGALARHDIGEGVARATGQRPPQRTVASVEEQVVDGGVVAVAVDCCLKELYPLLFQ